MNILINTPLLPSSLKESFDNKILIIFLTLIFILVILGLLFIDITRAFSGSASQDKESPSNAPKTALTV